MLQEIFAANPMGGRHPAHVDGSSVAGAAEPEASLGRSSAIRPLTASVTAPLPAEAAAHPSCWGEAGFTSEKYCAGCDVPTPVPQDAGMSTVEYAVGTVVAAAFAAVLYKIVTGDSVVAGLTNLINSALSTTF